MAALLSPISRFLLLAGLAYLGFYVFGLVMGVFALGEMLGFGAIALVVITATRSALVRIRRAVEDPDTRRERLGERTGNANAVAFDPGPRASPIP